MKQPRYRELRYGARNKKGLARCSVCNKPVIAGKVMEHMECLRKALRQKEGE